MEQSEQGTEYTYAQVDDAQAAYAAYGATTGGKNFRGEPMPDWDGLGDTIQRAWIAAAAAVHDRTERVVLRRLTARIDREGRVTAGRLTPVQGPVRDELCEWLRANGIDPGDVPGDAGFEIHDGQLTVEVVAREDGHAVAADRGFDGVRRTTRTVPLVVPFPEAAG